MTADEKRASAHNRALTGTARVRRFCPRPGADSSMNPFACTRPPMHVMCCWNPLAAFPASLYILFVRYMLLLLLCCSRTLCLCLFGKRSNFLAPARGKNKTPIYRRAALYCVLQLNRPRVSCIAFSLALSHVCILPLRQISV